MSIAHRKAELRQDLRSRRKALQGTGTHAVLSQAACQHLLSFFEQKVGAVVASYMPVGSELDTRILHTKREDMTLCLPVVERAHVLSFRHFDPNRPLVEGPHGTKHPPPEQPSLQPDIIIVPLLGFDRAGHRLGQGGGYYDATITHLRQIHPNIFAIGAAFSCQEAEIPVEPHDASLDAIATERGIHYV